MYRHPEVQYTELGFGGRDGLLVVWLFGKEWTTRPIVLDRFKWYMICLSWTHTAGKPTLYIDGVLEDIAQGGYGNAPPSQTSSVTVPVVRVAPFSPSSLCERHFLPFHPVPPAGPQRNADPGLHAPAGGWRRSGRSGLHHAGEVVSLSALGAAKEPTGSDVTDVHGGRRGDVEDGALGRWGLPRHLGSEATLR